MEKQSKISKLLGKGLRGTLKAQTKRIYVTKAQKAVRKMEQEEESAIYNMIEKFRKKWRKKNNYHSEENKAYREAAKKTHECQLKKLDKLWRFENSTPEMYYGSYKEGE